MSIHKRIKQRREALGLSMKTLAELCGYSSWQTIQQWEKEDESGTAPKRSKLPIVAAALQVSEEWLTTGRSTSKDQGVVKLTDLNPFESQLILLYRGLSGGRKDRLLSIANDLANEAEPDKASTKNPYPQRKGAIAKATLFEADQPHDKKKRAKQ